MLDNILNVAKDYLEGAVADNAKIPANKKKSVSDTILSSLGGSVQGQLGKNFDIGQLAGLLMGGNKSDFYKSTQKSISDALVKKTGLDPKLAQGIVSSVLPGLMKAITKKSGGNIAGGLLGSLLSKFGL